MEIGTIMGLAVSSLATIVAVVGIGWFRLDRMEQRIKADAQEAHDLIVESISTFREKMGIKIGMLPGEVGALRGEVSELRKEMTALTGRVGRIEGLLEIRKN